MIKNSRYTTRGAGCADIFNRIVRNFADEPVFTKGLGSSVDELLSNLKVILKKLAFLQERNQSKQIKNKKTRFTVISEMNVKEKNQNKISESFMRTSHLPNTFSNGDTTNWSHVF